MYTLQINYSPDIRYNVLEQTVEVMKLNLSKYLSDLLNFNLFRQYSLHRCVVNFKPPLINDIKRKSLLSGLPKILPLNEFPLLLRRGHPRTTGDKLPIFIIHF